MIRQASPSRVLDFTAGCRFNRDMNLNARHLVLTGLAALLLATAAVATNPLIMDQFTADPTARVFEGQIYVYPSHDIREPPGYKGRPNWFVMEDYHVFSS